MDNRLLIIFCNGEENTLIALKKDLASETSFPNSELLKLPPGYKNQFQKAQCDKNVYFSIDNKLGNRESLVIDARNKNGINYQKYNAFLNAFSKGYSSVCMIEGFNQDLPFEIIDRAFTRLRDFEVVLGPTLEGGCYLLGMNQLQPMFFSHTDWSDNMFIKGFVKEIQPAQLRTSLLPILSETVFH